MKKFYKVESVYCGFLKIGAVNIYLHYSDDKPENTTENFLIKTVHKAYFETKSDAENYKKELSAKLLMK